MRFPLDRPVGAAAVVGVCPLAVLVLVLVASASPSAYAAAECARVTRVAGQVILTNICGQCRNIQVVKDRGGNALPSLRTFVLNGGEQFPLPFKGPGATRVVSDGNCREDSQIGQHEQHKIAEALRQCILPAQTSRGVVLANSCNTCRSIVIERRYIDGRETHKSYALDAGEVLAFADEGAAGADIIHDGPCR